MTVIPDEPTCGGQAPLGRDPESKCGQQAFASPLIFLDPGSRPAGAGLGRDDETDETDKTDETD